ncbi:MAG TPA: PASTA domain-containing protein, partial [Candidatus Goldiibacteriota bacterium]|nr:PASTA domain-containing protein [Candidatus Goldiibacteriota bacterium]
FLMPDFSATSISEIYNAIRKYNLSISSLNVEENKDLESGSIISQSPLPGIRINKETPISFTVSRRPGDSSLRQRLIKFSYKLENAVSPSLVKIQVLSLNGSETVYNEVTSPGRVINESATVCGDALVQVFVATKIDKEMEFKAGVY